MAFPIRYEHGYAAVAGCMALIREALREQGKQKPSAALVKALLVNGAVNHSGPIDGPGFDDQQGLERVDVGSSIAMTKQSAFVRRWKQVRGHCK